MLILVNISGPRTGKALEPGTAETYRGLEHFGVTVENIEAEIERLTALGARVVAEPLVADPGIRVTFLIVPGGVRLELMERFTP